MKILILSHKPPYPILDGGCLAMARLLQDLLVLDRIETIDYHTLSTAKHPYVSGSFPADSKLTVVHHPIDTKVTLVGAVMSLVKQESYNLKRFQSELILKKIRKAIEETPYDFVIFESLFAATYASTLRAFSKAKFIYRAHNIEHQIWKDLASNTRNLPKKWYLQQLAYSLKWAERTVWSEDQGGLDLILTISDADLKQIENQTLSACRYLPASLNKPEVSSSLAPNRLCFLGAFNWQPNIEAVDWFLSRIFPILRKNNTQLEFHIAGKHAENHKHWQQPGVVVHGFVPDSSAFIAAHGIFVGCLQSGSGVKMKIIEAMSVGAPIVFSEKSTDGLPGFPSELSIANEQLFAAELSQLLQDPEALSARAQLSTTYFEAHFSTSHVQRQLLQLLEELQNNR